jgi:hypothetical protein
MQQSEVWSTCTTWWLSDLRICDEAWIAKVIVLAKSYIPPWALDWDEVFGRQASAYQLRYWGLDQFRPPSPWFSCRETRSQSRNKKIRIYGSLQYWPTDVQGVLGPPRKSVDHPESRSTVSFLSFFLVGFASFQFAEGFMCIFKYPIDPAFGNPVDPCTGCRAYGLCSRSAVLFSLSLYLFRQYMP